MSIDSINAAASATYAATRTANKPTADQGVQSSTARSDGTQDTIHMSAEARERLAVDAYAPPKGAVRVDATEALKSSPYYGTDYNPFEEARQYLEETKKFHDAKRKQTFAIVDKLHQAYGGSFSGAVIPNDFNKPITTLSGSPHPDADAIRSFLQDHKSEWDQLMALGKETFPSFQDWKSQQG